MFQEQLGRNMEVYVDDMLVKSRQMDQHLVDLAKTFCTLRRFHMKLHPAKCAFGVRSGKFLGYMVIEKGIKVNPEKIQAIQEMKPPPNLNEVQRLADCIAALNRFISQSAERSLPFFKALRKPRISSGMRTFQQAFRDMKAYLAQQTQLGETIYLYLAARQQTVNSVLIEEKRRTLEAHLLREQEGNEGNWLLHIDGSSTLTGSGVGVVLTSPEIDELEYALHFDFRASNNEIEYEALMQIEINWRKPLLDLGKDILSVDERETTHLKSRAARDGKLKIGVLSKVFNNVFLRLPLIPKLMGRLKSSIESWFKDQEKANATEAELETFRIHHYEQENNDSLSRANLDLIKKLQEDAYIRAERYKRRVVNAYNR
ncbi:UNVERIFIED_CONTAM: Retrovirus-related Pol polyprotein from transposon.6 [Sesamum angustifolium]|uniref:Retrovirus-related Pol polyprotein from transposon.6 n=1 Tax=Sesamum angustifolium TaxID=2727405 RepID=A0AAW2KFP7_9LAMI